VLQSVTAEASSKRIQWRIGLSMLESGLNEIKRLTDWKAYGGAPLLGFDRVAIKAHGRSEPGAIRNAIKVAAKAVRGGLTERIRDSVENTGW
jgi:glycerol-3-phosphate acyltransferase PlsX